MAYSPSEKYPGAVDVDPDYQGGKFRDNNPSTTNNGSPLKAIDRNELLARDEAIMNDAGFEYNGVADTPQDSQLFKAYKASLGNGANLLSNHNFLIQTPDDSQPLPSATPTSYPPGYQIFSGVFANETTGITNLTYIDGHVSFSGGDFYFPVPNTGAIARLTSDQLTASVADFDGKPRTRGVSFALVGDEYRVTVGVDALEDVSATLTPLGSVKFEQGTVATGHEVQSAKGQTYTFDTVAEMVTNRPPVGSRVQWLGYYEASDGGSNWGIVKSGAHTDDGGSIFSIDATTYVEANIVSKIAVRKFGLKGDGVEENARAQVLIDFSETGDGHSLRWQSGNYQVTNLTATKVIEWRGDSKNTVNVFSYATGNLLTAVKTGTGFAIDAIDCSIRDMSFNKTTGHDASNHCLSIERFIRLTIKDVVIFGAGASGIYMTECFVMRLTRIYGLFCGQNDAITGTEEGVIRYERVTTGNSLYIRDSYISNSIPTSGIRVNNIQALSITEVTLESCYKLINIGQPGFATRTVKIDGLYCENPVISCVDLESCANVVLNAININADGPRKPSHETYIRVLGAYDNVSLRNISIINATDSAASPNFVAQYEFNNKTGNTSPSVFVGPKVEMLFCSGSDSIALNDGANRIAVNTNSNPLGIRGLDKGIYKPNSNVLSSVDLETWAQTGTITVVNDGGVFPDGNDVFTVESTTGGYLSLNRTATYLSGSELCFSMFMSGKGRILLRGRRASDNIFEDVAEFSQSIENSEMRRMAAAATLDKDYNLFITRIYPEDELRISYPQLELDIKPSAFS